MDEYFSHIKSLIDAARNQAFRAVNAALIQLYWNLGRYISQQMAEARWGDRVIEQLSEYLVRSGTEYRSFSRRNLYRMRQFYEAWPAENEIVPPLVTQLGWTHHTLILSKTRSSEERVFYTNLAIKERYSKRELERQLDSAVYERTMLGSGNQVPALAQRKSLEGVFRDTYVFEFLNIPEAHSEEDLQKGLVRHLKQFILEIGKDFVFVGEEYRLQVGMQDFFIDLLFYHRELCCLVAIELKITDFKPDYLGQLNFYLEALDRDVKKPHENPSIGLLLCKGKDQEVVEYALSRSLSPAMVSEYRLKMPDKAMLQAKLHELFALRELDGQEQT
jgi:predicted nuclease of restriction endonuclease-like (RecB) superfamily